MCGLQAHLDAPGGEGDGLRILLALFSRPEISVRRSTESAEPKLVGQCGSRVGLEAEGSLGGGGTAGDGHRK